MHSYAGLADVHNEQPHDEGNGGNHFKVKQRKAPGLTDLFHVFHAGDTGHHRTENHRSDDHLDEFDEAVTERLHHCAPVRRKIAEQHAAHNGADHLKIKDLVNRNSLHNLSGRLTLIRPV